MPFMEADRPSIQLGLLSAIAAQHGFEVQTVHANLEFAAQLGLEAYQKLADFRRPLIGDWLFSLEAFGPAAPDPEGLLLARYATGLRTLGSSRAAAIAWLTDVRRRAVPTFLDTVLHLVDWGGVDVVGFTVSFQQTVASFALARRLKERHPELVTVFGGANFDGEMGIELMRAFDFIDLAVVGEGDIAFPRLLTALADRHGHTTIPGVVSRPNGEITATPPAPVADLNSSPVPDYRDYFDRAERLGLLSGAARLRTWLPLETSRGCWWGAKHHCVFCGLNAMTMSFRAKSAPRVLDELNTLARTFGSFHFACIDNIMDQQLLAELLPSLVESGTGYELFYEVKSNLSRGQVRELAQAGVSRIQPGLESLSSSVLSRMRKGVTAAQNVNLLRWARYYGIDVAWNMLWGIPGETADEYVGLPELCAQLVHLQPPTSQGRVWLERFSPMFTEIPVCRYRVRTPERSYSYVYPAAVNLNEIAYFFDYELVDALPDATYAQLGEATRQWRKAWRDDSPQLTYRHAPGILQIYDGRRPGRKRTIAFEGPAAQAYVACSDRPRSVPAVGREVAPMVEINEVQRWFKEFEELGVLMRDGDHVLSLALPATAGR